MLIKFRKHFDIEFEYNERIFVIKCDEDMCAIKLCFKLLVLDYMFFIVLSLQAIADLEISSILEEASAGKHATYEW